jgi:glucosamine-6-phosphate deaminase
MQKNFFGRVNIDSNKAYLPDGMVRDIEAECKNYDALIEAHGGIDIQLLGIGHNGHIGFNEPGDVFEASTWCVTLDERTIDANARFFDSHADVPRRAITMGIKTIMSARKILLAASGGEKSEILKKSLYGPITPKVPASILQLHPDVTVVTDSVVL